MLSRGSVPRSSMARISMSRISLYCLTSSALSFVGLLYAFAYRTRSLAETTLYPCIGNSPLVADEYPSSLVSQSNKFLRARMIVVFPFPVDPQRNKPNEESSDVSHFDISHRCCLYCCVASNTLCRCLTSASHAPSKRQYTCLSVYGNLKRVAIRFLFSS